MSAAERRVAGQVLMLSSETLFSSMADDGRFWADADVVERARTVATSGRACRMRSHGPTSLLSGGHRNTESLPTPSSNTKYLSRHYTKTMLESATSQAIL
jgi:hypothetical protein